MKLYTREVFIPKYTKNFNKGLSEADIKFYGKIHFDRSSSKRHRMDLINYLVIIANKQNYSTFQYDEKWLYLRAIPSTRANYRPDLNLTDKSLVNSKRKIQRA